MLVGILHPLPPPHPQLTFLYAFFLMEYFEEGKTEPEQLNKGDPYYSSLSIQLLSISNENHTFVIIHLRQHTFPSVSRFFFSNALTAVIIR